MGARRRRSSQRGQKKKRDRAVPRTLERSPSGRFRGEGASRPPDTGASGSVCPREHAHPLPRARRHVALVASLDAAPDAWPAWADPQRDPSLSSGAMVRDALNALGRPPSGDGRRSRLKPRAGAFVWRSDGTAPPRRTLARGRRLSAARAVPNSGGGGVVVAGPPSGITRDHPASGDRRCLPFFFHPICVAGRVAAFALCGWASDWAPRRPQGSVPAARAELARLPEDMRGFGWASSSARDAAPADS